jgi:hypothetical protein
MYADGVTLASCDTYQALLFMPVACSTCCRHTIGTTQERTDINHSFGVYETAIYI